MSDLDQSGVVTLRLELVSAGIVIVGPDSPLSPEQVSKLVRGKAGSLLLSPPLSFGQAPVIDSERGVILAHTIESARTFQAITIAPHRIEVQDRSGNINHEQHRLPDRMRALIDSLSVENASAVGINFEGSMTEEQFGSAAEGIARRLLRQELFTRGDAPHVSGTSLKLFLRGENGHTTTLQIEPRWNDPETMEIWLNSNTNVPVKTAPSLEMLLALYDEARSTFEQVLCASHFLATVIDRSRNGNTVSSSDDQGERP